MTELPLPPLPGAPASLEPRDQWNELECWVWRQVGSGKEANINEHRGKVADPKKIGDWSADRRLSADFLQTIALHEPYSSVLPRQGIKIIGAHFTDPVDLRDGRMRGLLRLHDCRFEAAVGFNGLISESVISLCGSVFERKIDMRALEVAGGLYMNKGARFREIDLYGARIGRNCNISHAVFTGKITLNALRIGGNLIAFDSAFEADVGLKGAHVSGMVDLRRSQAQGRFDMWWLHTGQDLLLGGMVGGQPAEKPASYFLLDARSAKIGGQLNLCHVDIAEGGLNLASITIANEAALGLGSEFAHVNLHLAKIGQHLSLASATVFGRLNLTGVTVGQDISFRRARFSEKVDLVFAAIDGNVQLCGGRFDGLDLTGTRIGGELRLTNCRDRIEWSPDAHLILRNTSADAIHDTPGAWPDNLELDGFVYHRFGGLDANADHDMMYRGSPWFIRWLSKDIPPTPQPYRQCAKVLGEMGHPHMADDVLYAGRERERRERYRNHEDLTALGLWFLKATIGYGHGAGRYFRTMYWVTGLMVVGVAVLMLTGDYLSLNNGLDWNASTDLQQFMTLVQAASYSLNKLLPVIDLPSHHIEIPLGTASKLYFQLHKLMGYVLALFMLAGITGLTR